MPVSNVSVVIPVYNEENNLRACLDALANQTMAPLEVIVVDNDSTDNSVTMARRYPFVKVISEKKKGVLYARYTGFEVANGQIIGSIDSDTRVPQNWVEEISKVFEDKQIDALSGGAYYYDLVWPSLFNTIDRHTRNFVSRQFKASSLLQGTNMALRKEAFNKVKNDLCWREDFQEDSDLAIHLNNLGAKIIYAPNIVAGVSVARSRLGFIATIRYYGRLPNTYKQHNIGQRYLLYLAVIVIVLSYYPVLVAHMIYSSKKQH